MIPGLKFTLKKNLSYDNCELLLKNINEEIQNKGFEVSSQQEKPAFKKS